MKRLITLSLMAVACSGVTDPLPTAEDFDGSGYLTIQTKVASYNWSDTEFSNNPLVTATITNVSSATYYTYLGDAYVLGSDQEILYVADGSDGYLEIRDDNGKWTSAINLPRMPMIEGVGIVALRPGSEYTLLMGLPGTVQPTGIFRLRINYSTQAGGGGGDLFTDYSNSFIIK